MTRYERQWILNHPLKWIRVCWWQWTIAVVLWIIAILRLNVVFDVLVGHTHWPIIISSVAGMCALSALSPLDERIQIAVTSILFGLSAFQVLSFLQVAVTGSLSSGGQVIAYTFAAHWFLIGAVALQWPRMSSLSGAELVARTGRDDDS